MQINNVLIVGWEVFPEEYRIDDDSYKYKNEIDADNDCSFVAQLAEYMRINWTMSGFVNDNSQRYFFDFE